jgi:hypothetical protein
MEMLDSPKRGRPKKDAVMESLAVRLPDELVTQIDTYAVRLQDQLPGLSISRADAIRQLLTVGLKVEIERLNESGAP